MRNDEKTLLAEIHLVTKQREKFLFKRGFFNCKDVFRAVGCFPGPYLANSFIRTAHNAKHFRLGLFKGGGN